MPGATKHGPGEASGAEAAGCLHGGGSSCRWEQREEGSYSAQSPCRTCQALGPTDHEPLNMLGHLSTPLCLSVVRPHRGLGLQPVPSKWGPAPCRAGHPRVPAPEALGQTQWGAAGCPPLRLLPQAVHASWDPTSHCPAELCTGSGWTQRQAEESGLGPGCAVALQEAPGAPCLP